MLMGEYQHKMYNKGRRIIAFGRWAGMVGAYNGLRGFGIRRGDFDLKPAHQCYDMQEMFAGLKLISLNPIKKPCFRQI